jgi:gluconate:H+ symporter, GntP family
MLSGFPLLLLIAAAIVFIIIAGSRYKWHPFLVLLLAALFTAICSGQPLAGIANTASEGFGNMMKKIGLVVILGTLIGTVLEKSGAILQLAEAILRLFGPRRPIAAITVIGAVIGIPIFCDSGFVILSGLARPLAQRSGKSYAAVVCGLASGLYITHTLLPPHPGSIAGAANLGLKEHLATVIGIGFLLVIPVTVMAWWFSSRVAAKVVVKEEPSAAASTAPPHRPALWKCILPVVVPVLLIALASFSIFFHLPPLVKTTFEWIGHPVMALLIGLALSLLCIPRQQMAQLQPWLKEGALHAGNILVIVGAGGILGEVLKQLPLAGLVSGLANGSGSQLVFLTVAWCMGVLLKTAQGSTTSAIIVVSSILAPLATAAGFNTPVEGSLLLAAIAGGTMMVSHANDAYFWVIGQFGGLTMPQTYKTFSLATVAMSLTVLVSVLLVSLTGVR